MQYNWKKNTAVFLTSQAISIFGSSLVQYAISWHIMLTTKSGVYTTLAIVCGFVPMLLLSPFAGVWADRYSRKRLIILSDGGIALVTLILAILFLAGYDSIWLMLAVLAIRGVGTAIQNPCVNAILPDVVPTEQLTRVNGIYGSLTSFINLLSPMLGGVLLGVWPIEYIFFIDVCTAAIAIAVMLTSFSLPRQEREGAPGKTDYFREMKEGFTYILQTKFLRTLLLIVIVFCFFAAPLAFLTPLQVARNYGDDVWRLSAIEVAFSMGMVLGGLLISAWGGMKNRVHTMTLSCLCMAAGSAALGFSMGFWPYVAVMAFVGLTMPLFNTPSMVILQERIDPGVIGRVFSVMT
ncbi:MFS transporter, partial [Oscillospiraceae bacterium OttesenSCG-928-G22]|nr:MFS transporter [Oscillospiraceae bacterium OttesenSCG-928-G22]